jgi:hypothetical protein
MYYWFQWPYASIPIYPISEWSITSEQSYRNYNNADLSEIVNQLQSQINSLRADHTTLHRELVSAEELLSKVIQEQNRRILEE